MNIRIAETEEYEKVKLFYDSLIDAMQEAEYKPGWEKNVYPTQEFLLNSIKAGELYLGEKEGTIAACMIVNHLYNDGYNTISWAVKAEDAEVLVIHALGVYPLYAKQGLAKQMVQRVVETAKENRIKAIRLDVLEGNIPAEKTYTKMGFVYRDTVKMFYEDTGWTNYKLFEYIV